MIKPSPPRLEGGNFEGDQPATKGQLFNDQNFPELKLSWESLRLGISKIWVFERGIKLFSVREISSQGRLRSHIFQIYKKNLMTTIVLFPSNGHSLSHKEKSNKLL